MISIDVNYNTLFAQEPVTANPKASTTLASGQPEAWHHMQTQHDSTMSREIFHGGHGAPCTISWL